MTPAAPAVLAARLERIVLRRPTRRQLFVVRDERTHPGFDQTLRRTWRSSLAYCEAGGRPGTSAPSPDPTRPQGGLMTTIERTVTTTAPPEKVFAYLLDFRNTTEWDSATKSCELLSGDGGPGTVYRNVSALAGNEVELDYTVEAVDEPTSFTIVGRNDTTTSHDTVTVTPHAAGSTVVYRAEFSFTGVARLAGPLMKPLLDRLGDKTAEQLKSSLDRL